MRLLSIVLLLIFSAVVQAQSGSSVFLDALEAQNPPSSAEKYDQKKGRLFTLTTPIGTTLQAFEAGPEDAAVGILLLHDRWGLTDELRQRVRIYALKGYKALAIDMFDQRISTESWLATEIAGAVDTEAVKVNVSAALDYLSLPGRKLATVGWGFGGWQSYQAALIESDKLSAAVVGYSPLFASVKDARQVAVPVLGIFAQQDERISQVDIRRFYSLKAEAYKNMDTREHVVFQHHMIDASRGFIAPSDSAYNKDAAKNAWLNVDEFLAKHLE